MGLWWDLNIEVEDWDLKIVIKNESEHKQTS